MSNGITVDITKLAKNVMSTLDDYAKLADDAVDRAVDKVAHETVDDLRETSPKKSGGYRRSWAVMDGKDAKTGTAHKIVHSRSPHYRKTMLLEHGHRKWLWGKRTGDRVNPIEHIAPAQKRAEERLTAELKKEIENAR